MGHIATNAIIVQSYSRLARRNLILLTGLYKYLVSLKLFVIMSNLSKSILTIIFVLQVADYITQIESVPTLPLIWGRLSVEPMDEEPSGYYWIMAEVHFNESNMVGTTSG